MKSKTLAIIGSGDLGQQIAHFAITDGHFKKVVFFDDFKKVGTKVKSFEVIGKVDDILNQFNKNAFDELIIGIGYQHIEKKADLFNFFYKKIPFAKIIHSTCIIDKTSKIESGVIIYPGCIVDANVIISNNVLLNIGVTIAHDTKIGDHSFISPRVSIAGFTSVGKNNILGINSTIIDNITTCDKVQIGGGAVVVNNIEKQGVYVGVPVKIIK